MRRFVDRMLGRCPSGGARRAVVLAAGLLMLGVASTSALQHAAFDRALRSADFVERAQSMRVVSARLRRELSDALIVVGEHALNGGPAPLPRFAAARAAVQTDLDALARLSDQDDAQGPALATVRAAVDAVMGGLSAALDQGHDDLSRSLATLRDQRLSERIAVVGQALEALDAHEQRLLAQRRQTLEADRTRTELMLAGGNALALAAMLALLGLAVRAHLRSRLAEEDARYRVLFEASPMPMWVLDRDTDRFLEVNAAAIAKYGWSREAFLALSPCDRRLNDDPQAMRALLHGDEEPARSAELRHRRSDGTPLEVTAFVSALVFRGRPARLAAIEDTTHRRASERLLIERERLLKDLSRKLLNAQDDERRAIARELHDHLLQEVAGAKLALLAARRSTDRGALDARLAQALAAFDALIAQLRNRALDLHPAILEDLGLSAAIDWLCERQRALAGLPVLREPDEPVPRLDRETEAGAFRIAQEALSNAIRHARARTVRVRVGAEGGRLRLTVSDDGIGMSPEQHGARLRDSLGLVSMRERADLLGGRLSIDSAPGRGTRVEADLPLARTP